LAKVSGSPVGRTTQFKITLSNNPTTDNNPVVTVTPSPIQAVVSSITLISTSGSVLTYECSVAYDLASGNAVTLTVGISGAQYTTSTKTLTYSLSANATTVAIFAGGAAGSNNPSALVDYRFGNGTGGAGTALTQARWYLTGAGSDKTANAYFAGGATSQGTAFSMDYRAANGTGANGTLLGTERRQMGGAASGTSGVFAGGLTGGDIVSNIVDYRTGAGTGAAVSTTFAARYAMCSMHGSETGQSGYALFYGGRTAYPSLTFTNTSAYYLSTGVLTGSQTTIGTANVDSFGCRVGDGSYAMGGSNGSDISQTIYFAAPGSASIVTGLSNQRSTRNGAAAQAGAAGVFWSGDGLSQIITRNGSTTLLNATQYSIYPFCYNGSAATAGVQAVFTGGSAYGNGTNYPNGTIMGITTSIDSQGIWTSGLTLPTARMNLGGASAKSQEYV
jgi:hypothetical protein